jgi:hypothetical protein
MGIDEADSAQGQVSWISPIARALLKAREGDVVKLVTPLGAQEIEVLRCATRRGRGRVGADALHAQHRGGALEDAHHGIEMVRSRTAIDEAQSVASCGFSSPMSTCVMSASALASAAATRASTPLPLAP